MIVPMNLQTMFLLVSIIAWLEFLQISFFCDGFVVTGKGQSRTEVRRKNWPLSSLETKNEDVQVEKSGDDNSSSSSSSNNNNVMNPPEDFLSREILTMDPSDLEIVFFCDSDSISCPSDITRENLVTHEDKKDEELEGNSSIYPIVSMMRASANYVANHRGTVSVVHIDAASYLNDAEAFHRLMDDIALTWLLGMKLVLVLGCDTPVYERCECKDGVSYQSSPAPDRDAGWMRFEVERVLNGCIRPHLGLGGDVVNGGNVVSSGSFFTAAPYGYGKDSDKGYPVELQTRKLEAVLERNDVVLLTSVGLSTSNDVNAELVHVQSETLAAYVASTLKASKLVFVSHNHDINLQNVRTGKTIQNFCLKDAKDILRHYDFQMSQQYVASLTSKHDEPLEQVQFLFRIGWAALALQNGAERAHIVGPSDGALLTELFTPKDGSATCIVQDDVLNEEGLLHPDEDFREAADSGKFASKMNHPRPSSLPPPLHYRLF